MLQRIAFDPLFEFAVLSAGYFVKITIFFSEYTLILAELVLSTTRL